MRDRFQKMNAVTTFKVCFLKYKIINVLNLKHIIYKNSVCTNLCPLWKDKANLCSKYSLNSFF